MKRWIALLLALAMLLSLAACAKEPGQDKEDPEGSETAPLTGSAVFFTAPVAEGESPEDTAFTALTAPQTAEDGTISDPGTAAALHDAITALTEADWTDNDAANHDPFYYNGALTFSDSQTEYRFSYGAGVVAYDHWYAAMPDSFFSTLKTLAEDSGLGADHFRTQPKPEMEPYFIYDPNVMPEGGERDGVKYVAWDGVVEHLFFHPIIAYPELAFDGTAAGDDMDDWMVTVGEFNKILQNVYEKGYILVDINDVWSEVTGDDGQPKMVKNTLYIPEGTKPLIFSYDDTNYYEYMLEGGLTYKLILGEDGKVWSWGLDPQGNEVVSRDLDAIPILDKFVEEHPDFSPFGAKACLSLTGYEGILGYRTNTTTEGLTAEQEAVRQQEREAVKPIIEELKRTGWTFGSHTWGHIRLSGNAKWKLEDIQKDTQLWFDEVGSLVGETKILFYPHGERPDGQDWTSTGPIFQYLQSQGFRVFASVGVEPFSYIKKDICAVICDRMHPDGKTLRWSRNRYMRFYDAKEIMDTSVRPDLGVGEEWNE